MMGRSLLPLLVVALIAGMPATATPTPPVEAPGTATLGTATPPPSDASQGAGEDAPPAPTGPLELTLVAPDENAASAESDESEGRTRGANGDLGATSQAPPPSGDPGELFALANGAYEEGNYGRAVELYEALLAQGIDNGRLHYNLGNAYLRGGELGRAIASYLRAQRALPRDQDTAANLAFARRSARDALAPPEPSAVQETLFFWHYRLSPAELFAAMVILNVLFWGVLAIRLFQPSSEVWRWLSGLLLVPLLAVAASWTLHRVAPQDIAVIVPQEVDIRSGTSRDTVVRFKLHAGTEVAVLEQRPDWLRIELPDGQQGWLAQQHAERVRR